MAWYDNINRRGYGTTQAWPEYNENFGQSFAGVGRFDPRNLMRPDNLTQDLGAANYQAPTVYPGSAYSPQRGFEEMQFDETVQAPERTGILENFKNKLSGFTTPTMEFLKKIGGRMTPEKRAEVEAIRGSADKYGWGNLPGTGLQGNIWSGGSGGDKVYVRDPATGTLIVRDKNVQSGFGSKTIGDMVQKKEDWMQGQFEKYGDEWTDDEHRGLSTKLYNYAKKKGLIDQWKGAIPPVITGEGDKPGRGPITITPSHFAEQGGGGYQQAPINRPDPSFSDPSTTGHMGPGGVHYAYGGRVGYQDGELVEDEYMAEATPGGMMEENIEEVQGEPSREQLEAIALEIFRLPLEELNEEQLNVVYQAAMEQEPSEEEVQFAAQEGPGQGIASLV